MLSPVLVRICWIAVMAPALTEAATQADNFSLPSSTPNNKLGDLSLQALSEIVGVRHIVRSTNEGDLVHDSRIRRCIPPPWKILHADDNNFRSKYAGLDLEETLKSVRPLARVGGDPAGRIMSQSNRQYSHQDNMGLLKAKTSMECPNSKNNGSYSTTPVVQPPRPNLELASKIRPNLADRNCNNASSLRRLTANENFRNFQWSNGGPREGVREARIEQEAVGQDVFGRNATLKSRARHVLRRIRKLQLRHVEFHAKGQLRSFVDHEQRSLGIPCQRHLESQFLRARNAEELKAELLQSEDVKLLSTAALVNLVRKLEHGTHSLTQSRNLCETILNKDRKRIGAIARVDPAECHEIKRTSGTLLADMRHLESAADSDATDSSSGGESTDELSDSEDVMNRPEMLSKRQSAMSWAEARAAAASQWTWLQAQVSDLEYKIRQQNDLYRQVRASKGAVTLDGARTIAGGGRWKDSSGAAENSEAPKSVNGFLDGVSNGYSAVRRLMTGDTDSQKVVGDIGFDSCRTRPLKRAFRKRKLVRTVGIHLVGRKTSRLSSVKCGCNSQRELLPCVLCGGRYNNTQTLDPDVMPLTERVALLDPAYHMILSFKQETPLSIHFEKLLRRDEYCKAVKNVMPIKKKARIPIQQLSLSDQARKHSRKLAKNAAQTLLTSAKLRRKLVAQSRRGKHSRFLLSSRDDPGYRKKYNTLAAYRRRRARQRNDSLSSESSKPGSPVPSSFTYGLDSGSGKVASLQELLRRRRLDSAYDINNIVIPYSIAATTRVEKLQYKEILTPKWRLVEPSESTPENELPSDENEEAEDISDDTFATRHLKCELEEKKRFLGYKQMHGRSRLRSIRGDSRADSSGANTPDPMSPHPPDTFSHDSYGWNSPVASPPPTPASVVVQLEEHGLAGSVRLERRRTISMSKRLSEDDRSSVGEEAGPPTLPYEERVFPLAEEDYQEMLLASSHLGQGSKETEDPLSPASSTTGSVPEEDPNDPEWSVVMEDRSQKPSLVLKLAKK